MRQAARPALDANHGSVIPPRVNPPRAEDTAATRACARAVAQTHPSHKVRRMGHPLPTLFVVMPRSAATRNLLLSPRRNKSRSIGDFVDAQKLVSLPTFARRSSLGMTTIMLCAMALALALAASARATIRYDISLAHPERHQFHVTMTVPVAQGAQGNVTVQMPAWNALYQIRDFGARVHGSPRRRRRGQFPASAAARQAARGASRRARPAPKFASSTRMYWDEPGPFDTQLDSDHAFLNLAMVLCYVPERRGEDEWCILPMCRGIGALRSNFARQIRTRRRIDANYDAPNYDALVDAPVEIGQFEEWQLYGRHARRGPHDPRGLSRRARGPRRAHAHAVANRELRNRHDGRRALSRVHLFPARGPELRRRRNGARQLHGHFRG